MPEFVDVEIEDKVRTAIKIAVEHRVPESPAPVSTEPESLETEPIGPETTEPDNF